MLKAFWIYMTLNLKRETKSKGSVVHGRRISKRISEGDQQTSGGMEAQTWRYKFSKAENLNLGSASSDL